MRLTYNFDTWDGATITSSSEAATDLGDDNVVDYQPSKIWRTNSAQAEWIKFDLGAATLLTCLGMFNFNLTETATVTLEAHASDSWGAPSFSEVLAVATDSDSVVYKKLIWFGSETYQWWRITLDDYPANTDNYLQIGRIAAGAYYEPSRNIADNYAFTPNDPSERERVPGAFTPSRSRGRYDTIAVDIPFVDRTQRDKWNTIFRKIGNENPVILSLDPTDQPTVDSWYCQLGTPLSTVARLADYFDVGRLVWEEKVR